MRLARPIPVTSCTGRSESDLLTSAGKYDRAAFDELVRRYIDFVYAIALRATGDTHEAEDITQAVFLVLGKKAGSIKGHALSCWLHRTTCYAAANARRVTARRASHEKAAARPEVLMPHVADDSEFLLKQLDDAIGSLGEKDRQVVIDRYLKGLEISAVAQTLGTTPAGVQKRLERAVAKLRTYFNRRSRSEAITPAIVTALLLAAAPSSTTAASAALTAATMSTSPSPVAIAIAKGVHTTLTVTKVKVVIAAVLITAVLGGASMEVARRWRATLPIVSREVALLNKPPAGLPAVPFATLRSGVTVALVGVSSNPSYKQLWWHADGSPLATPPYALAGLQISELHPGNLAREFAFICDLPPKSAEWVIDVCAADNDGEENNVPMDKFGRSIPGNITEVAEVPDQPAIVRFNLTTAPWKTFLTTTRTGGELAVNPKGNFSVGALQADGKDSLTHVTGAYTSKRSSQTRLVALDASGAEHPGEQLHFATIQPPGEAKVWQAIYRFEGLKLPDIKMVMCQSRRFEQWVEFRNVCVHPGKITPVFIDTSDAPSADSPR